MQENTGSRKTYILSVFDQKAEMYLPPFHAVTLAVGERYFSTAIANEEHEFAVNHEDYSLWLLGTIDDHGVITPSKALLASATSIMGRLKNKVLEERVTHLVKTKTA